MYAHKNINKARILVNLKQNSVNNRKQSEIKKKKDFVVVFSVVASTSIKHKKSKAKNEKKKIPNE